MKGSTIRSLVNEQIGGGIRLLVQWRQVVYLFWEQMSDWRKINSICLFGRTYYWYDEKGKKTKCTAPQYVDFVMSSVQKLVTDEDIFPTKYGESVAPPSDERAHRMTEANRLDI